MTADSDGSLSWWEVRGEQDFIRGVASEFSGMGVGWQRVIDLAHDSLNRPHESTADARLTLECREMAELLLEIVLEDGHTETLAGCLHTLVRDVAQREKGRR